MNVILKSSLKFMTRGERLIFFSLVGLRSASSLLDLSGVLAIGYIATSFAEFVTNGSDISRTLGFAGLEIPAVTIQTLPLVAAFTLGLFLAKALLSIWLTGATAQHLSKIDARASRKIAESVLGQSLAGSGSVSREELQFVAFTGSTAAFSGTLSAYATIVSEGSLFIGLLVTFALVDWLATIYTVLFFGLLVSLIHLLSGEQLRETGREIAARSVDALTALNNLHNAFRELTVLRKKTFYFDKLEQSKLAAARVVGRQQSLVVLPRHLVETAVIFGIFAFAGFKLASGDLTNAAATTGIFLTGSLRLMAAMLPWQVAIATLKGISFQAQQAQSYIRDESSASGKEGQNQHGVRPFRVSLNDVSYRYPGLSRNAVSNVNIEIEPGSHVALIGPSGAGKSTIADLMTGLLSPSHGEVRVAGVAPQDAVGLAYVPQKPGSLSGSIYENVAVGENLGQDMARLNEAIELADLKDLISSLELGPNTNMGVHGDGFSGGQLQRIGIARALYSKPGFLVLDEATSALDAESEFFVSNTLRKLKGNVTVVTIAHRLSTIKEADVVFFIEDGRVVDRGNLDDIRKRNPSIERAITLTRIDSAGS